MIRGKILLFFLTIAGVIAGNRLLAQAVPQVRTAPAAGPHILVYKTRKDYSRKVPVLLSDDKRRILSYPDPRDVAKKNGKYPEPTRLKNGYLLDNRGIGPNVAYLKIEYAQYARLPQAPSPDTLMSWIIDPDPLTELYDCGSRYRFKSLNAELNQRISNGQLKKTALKLK